jgi:hypothetical protein
MSRAWTSRHLKRSARRRLVDHRAFHAGHVQAGVDPVPAQHEVGDARAPGRRIIQSCSQDSVIREFEEIRDTVPGFTGAIIPYLPDAPIVAMGAPAAPK